MSAVESCWIPCFAEHLHMVGELALGISAALELKIKDAENL